jgi:3-deoxy-7-phosphoheptulonate synthase
MSAEYMLACGNVDVILCERRVRTFSDHSRRTLDLSIIPPAKALCHLPILPAGTGLGGESATATESRAQ